MPISLVTKRAANLLSASKLLRGKNIVYISHLFNSQGFPYCDDSYDDLPGDNFNSSCTVRSGIGNISRPRAHVSSFARSIWDGHLNRPLAKSSPNVKCNKLMVASSAGVHGWLYGRTLLNIIFLSIFSDSTVITNLDVER